MKNLIIPDIQTLHELIPQAQTLDFKTMKTHLQNAQRQYLESAIGKSFLKKLCALAEKKVENPSDELLDSLFFAQSALANFAYMLAVPSLQVIVNESGIQRIENSTHKTAYQYQVIAVQKSYFNTAYQQLESLLVFLEEHKKETDFKSWADSDAYFEHKDYLLYSASLFNSFVSIDNSRWRYHQFRQIMREVEENRIEPLLTPAFFQRIKEQLIKDNLHENYKQVVKHARYATAYLTLADDLTTRIAKADVSGGLSLFFTNSTQTVNAQKPAELDRFEALTKHYQQKGEHYLKVLDKELHQNKRNYPLFEQSLRASADPEKKILTSKNGKGAFF